MYLVMKEKDWDDVIQWNIYEVEGKIYTERAHAGSDYEYFRCQKNPANKILPQVFLGGDNKLFDSLDEAKSFAEHRKQIYVKTLMSKIESCKINIHLF